jgi:hypothetical protein
MTFDQLPSKMRVRLIPGAQFLDLVDYLNWFKGKNVLGQKKRLSDLQLENILTYKTHDFEVRLVKGNVTLTLTI